MRSLAIETSIQPGSIALLQRGDVVLQVPLPAQQRTAQSLAPALAAALAQSDWPASSIELVSVAHGPGSFTGLRIATTAAKTFAYAVQAQLVALNTLDVIVAQLPASITDACAVMDAQRGQLFAARYLQQDGQWRTQDQCQIIDRQALATLLGPDTVLTGPGLARLAATVAPDHVRVEPNRWNPRASTVGILAWQALQRGHTVDPFQLQPQYYRPSYAEEKQRG